MPHRISKGHATATSPKPPRPIERSVPSPRRRRRRNPSSFLLLRHGHRLAHSAGGLLHRVRRRPGLCHHPPLPAKLRPPAQHQGTPQLQQHRRRADRRRRVVRLPRRSPPLRRRRSAQSPTLRLRSRPPSYWPSVTCSAPTPASPSTRVPYHASSPLGFKI